MSPRQDRRGEFTRDFTGQSGREGCDEVTFYYGFHSEQGNIYFLPKYNKLNVAHSSFEHLLSVACMTVDMQTYPLSHFMAAHQAFNGRRFPDACRDHLPSSCGIPAVSSFLEMMKGKRRRRWWRQLLLTEQSGMAAVTPGHSPGVRYPIWSLATAELGAEVGHPVKSTGALI